MTLTKDWDKTFARDETVAHSKVTYSNRLGIELTADLYLPRGFNPDTQYPALVVGHPFGGVKEQTAGLYAQTMATFGFVTLAFDASFNGESGGTARHCASPDVFVEDFSASVDFLGIHPSVDRDRIGAIGVCASGAFVLAAAQIDPRIKAVATSAMYDIGGVVRDGLGKTATDEARAGMLQAVGAQRWREAEGGAPFYVGASDTLPDDADAVTREFFDYYRTPRGFHARSHSMSMTLAPSFFQFRPFDHLNTLAPRPLLMITGEVAHSRYFTEDAFAAAAEPKEMIVVPGAGHVDLYDRVDLIPWDRLQTFFTRTLAA